jgi:predicted deacetylase
MALSASDARVVCVSIHDVAPATWPACLRLLEAVRQVADIPTTLLVVPRYHGATGHAGYEAMLAALLAQGHELALHGYTHLDRAPPARGLRGLPQRYWREVFTTGEGEFAAISALRAQRLLALGLAWFAGRGWPVSGFVAPAWLLGAGAWQALHGHAFSYTTTLTHFHLLPSRRALFSPSLVYSTRNRGGRCLSPAAVTALAGCLAPAPLVRLGLHPRDADFPRLVLHAQRVLGSLLEQRQALTKAAFARGRLLPAQRQMVT